jgi:hypothetical protein
MYLLVICISSSKNCLFNSFANLLIRFSAFLMFSFMSSLYILHINPLTDEWLSRRFSHSLGYLLILETISLDVQKLFILMQSHLLTLLLFPGQLESYSENS